MAGFDSHDDLLALLITARDADPRDSPWGVLVQDPWEDGRQQFFWYLTRRSLQRALLDAHAFVDPEAYAERDEWVEARVDLQIAFDEIGDALGPQHAERLDEITNEDYCIVWIGTIRDLGLGESQVAEDVREQFRGGDDDDLEAEVDDSPISDEELPEFVAFLQQYGD